jgi:hypothetical protein
VSTTQTGNPFVNLKCYGNGIGYNSWSAFWPAAGSFILSSPAWTSGAADCTGPSSVMSAAPSTRCSRRLAST